LNQKYGAFNFGYQFWFLGLIVFTFIIGPSFHFDYINVKLH
jgi:hypothetical protein